VGSSQKLYPHDEFERLLLQLLRLYLRRLQDLLREVLLLEQLRIFLMMIFFTLLDDLDLEHGILCLLHYLLCDFL
jgi:hypothetical protein